jgi:catechol 2,3-dioxygenase-like lactoylglutathione lyase family enzyme
MTAEPASPERASRRLGVLGVHSVDRVHFTVPDLAEAERFYGTFGLAVESCGDRLDLRTDGDPVPWATLTEGRRKALGHISFGCFEDDLPRLRARLDSRDIACLDPPRGIESNGLWFRDPDGTLIEIRAGAKRTPDVKPPSGNPPGIAGIPNASDRAHAAPVRPSRLAHVLIFTRDLRKTMRFYADVLGLGFSDVARDGVGFMHGVHGSDHHIVAFLKSEGPGLHHLSWDVGSIESIGLGAMRMAGAGYRTGWGLGRHVLGSNYFYYVRDPWGSWCEYASDVDYIPAGCDWPGGDHPPEDSFYLWGPDPPADFGVNHEAMP